MSLRWWSSCKTDVGRRRRINEDAYLDMYDVGLWLVADGMGGHAGGEVASRMVVESLKGLPAFRSLDEFIATVRERLLWVNRHLNESSHEYRARDPRRTIGSTVVALLVFKGQACCLWAGDSRAYLLRDGKLIRITRDHSVAEEMVERGELAPEEAERHPAANRITRAVGAQQEIVLDERRLSLRDGDAVLLCSDGLNKEVSEAEIEKVLDAYDCDVASQELIDLSLERGARDNVTVAVVRFEETTGFGDSALHTTTINSPGDRRKVGCNNGVESRF